MNAEELLKIQDAVAKQIESSVGVAVKVHVNGKINLLTQEFRDYVKDDMDWKERAKPTIELGNNIRGFNKGVLYVASTGGALFGLFKCVAEFTKFINK